MSQDHRALNDEGSYASVGVIVHIRSTHTNRLYADENFSATGFWALARFYREVKRFLQHCSPHHASGHCFFSSLLFFYSTPRWSSFLNLVEQHRSREAFTDVSLIPTTTMLSK